MENSVFHFPVSDFHSIKPGLTKHVLLVGMGYIVDCRDIFPDSLLRKSPRRETPKRDKREDHFSPLVDI